MLNTSQDFSSHYSPIQTKKKKTILTITKFLGFCLKMKLKNQQTLQSSQKCQGGKAQKPPRRHSCYSETLHAQMVTELKAPWTVLAFPGFET